MGYDAISVQNDFSAGLRRMEAAVEKDPTFALAHMIRMYGYAMTGQFSKVASARQAAQQHKYRLVEPLRYALRTSSLIASQEVEAAQEAVEQWTTLYPNDVMAWTNLAQIQQLRGEPVEAARSLRQVVDLDPGQVKLRLQIAALLTRAGEYDEAIEDLTAYTKAFPSRAEGYTRLGEAHAAEGNPERALEAHRKALQQGPNDPTVLRRLGNAYQRMGEFEEAETHLRQALRQAQSPEQVETAYLELTQYFRERGQTGAFLTYVDSLFETADSYMPQHVTLMRKASMAPHLYRHGDRERALRIVEEAKAVIDRGGDRSVDPAALHVAIARTYTETGDLEKAASHIEEAERLFEAYGFTGLSQRFSIHHARGRLLQAQGKPQEAIAAYARDIEVDPADTGSRYRIAVIYHEIGRTTEAERYFQRVLDRSPGHPLANAAYAALLSDTGRSGEARMYLERALTAWSEADREYEPARTARALRDSLGAEV
jgi:tetratricopeptide (TPR) repeat protein